MSANLPRWVSKPLGELTDKIGSGATPRGGQSAYKESGISLIRSLNIHDLEFRYKDLAKIDDEQAAALTNVEVEARDVLLNITGASIARCVQAPLDVLPARVNQHVSILRPKNGLLDSRFLSYLLVSDGTKNQLLNIGDKAGATRQALTKAQLHAFAIPVPPLDEQKRIVAVLDQAFAALDRARAHAETNLADAEVLRQLGADQLLDCYTGSASKTLLGDLAEFRNGLNFSRHSSGESVKVAGVGDFKNNFWLPVDGLNSTIIEGRLSDSDRLRAGDILAVRSNGNKDLIGRVMLVGEIDEVISFSGFVIRIRLIAEGIKPEFLCHYMKSKSAVAHLLAGGGGANISNLNQGILSSLPIAVPSPEDQQKFVDSMNLLNMSIEKLAEVAASKLTDLATLCQSLLQKAFSGQL